VSRFSAPHNQRRFTRPAHRRRPPTNAAPPMPCLPLHSSSSVRSTASGEASGFYATQRDVNSPGAPTPPRRRTCTPAVLLRSSTVEASLATART